MTCGLDFSKTSKYTREIGLLPALIMRHQPDLIGPDAVDDPGCEVRYPLGWLVADLLVTFAPACSFTPCPP